MKQIFSFVTTMLAMITICYAQANRQLSNLTSPTAVNVNLLPGGTTGTKNLGSDTKQWKNGYFNGTVNCNAPGNYSFGIISNGGSYGVYAHGYSSNSYGVYGLGGLAGVYGGGTSSTAYGVRGDGGSTGVVGFGGPTGVYGNGDSYGVYAFSSGWAGYFNGKVYSSGGYHIPSDQKLKQNIRDFTSAMDIINKLKPKQYEYMQEGNYKLMNLPQGSHFGLIAQDVEKTLPDLVTDTKFETAMARPQQTEAASQQTQEAGKTETKSEIIEFKALNYTELIPVLIKGMQELAQENSQLKSELTELKQLVSQYIKPIAATSPR
jgi:hypothetical protein